MFSQMFPVLMATGNLPTTHLELDITNVYNRSGSALAVGNVVQFDFHGSQAESLSSSEAVWNTTTDGGSVLSNVCFPPTVAATLRSLSCAVFGVATTVAADNATGTIRVIGEVNVVKAASANHAIGDTFIGVAGAATVAVTSGTLTGAKIIALAKTAGTSTTALKAMFNGFGFGSN